MRAMMIYLDYQYKNVKQGSVPKGQGMSPRAYRAGERRQAATQATRARIVAAARELLGDPSTAAFSIDAVAERADVARMTVYYQFKSKGKLLEALFDDFGERANMSDLRKAFREPDPARSIALLVEQFCHLWKSEGALLPTLNAMAALDPEVDRALQERGSWRREALREIVGRAHRGRADAAEIVDLLHVLTSFETYDMLVAGGRSHKNIVAMLQRAAAAMLTFLPKKTKAAGSAR
jgi:AcrR family transcriptional regulator